MKRGNPQLCRLWEEFGPCCHYCEREMTLAIATTDHIVPRAWGGTNAYSNLCLACRACNQSWGPAVAKCSCPRCAAALSWHLNRHNRPKRVVLEGVSGIALARAVTEMLVECESLIEQMGGRNQGDPSYASLAGKCKAYRKVLRMLQHAEIKESA